jgi:hypothetical protein
LEILTTVAALSVFFTVCFRLFAINVAFNSLKQKLQALEQKPIDRKLSECLDDLLLKSKELPGKQAAQNKYRIEAARKKINKIKY